MTDNHSAPGGESAAAGAGDAVLRAIAAGRDAPRHGVLGFSRLRELSAEQDCQLDEQELYAAIQELECAGLLRRGGAWYFLTPIAAALGYLLPWERPLVAHPRSRFSILAE
jgi:hypothetical protein